MSKRALSEVSSTDYREYKRLLTTPVSGPVNGSKKIHIPEQECTSSVGSYDPILEVINLSDDDDEVESPCSKTDTSADKSQTARESQVVVENGCGEFVSVDEDWFEKYGGMIVDENGFLLGEFRRLDEELYVNITVD
ncbi:hypothetical protein HanIR_Chr16g0840651 [Helianthus annuus]|nr:hypothetical protein HanIR_Chr16g0840651 [Helianthus annuus]